MIGTNAGTGAGRRHAARLQGVGSTIFAEMSALAVRTGSVNLGQGFPDLSGPVGVIERAGEAMRAGTNQYPPGHGNPEHYRLRYDTVDTNGKISFRRAGHMHHLGIGAANIGKRVLAIADDTTITVIHLHTGELLSTHTIDPNRHYWRNTQKAPGRWPKAL